MLSRSLRPFRTLALTTVIAASAGSVVVAAPAIAAGGHTGATAKTVVKKAKKTKRAKKTTLRADLVAGDLALDYLSDGFSVDATIGNVGTKRSRKSDVSIAISSNTVLDAADDVLEVLPIGRVQPGAERSVETEVEIPEDLPAGDVYLLVCADGNAAVKEKVESNNCTSELVASDTQDVDLGSDESDEDEQADDDQGATLAGADDASGDSSEG